MAISETLASLNKIFGNNTLMAMGDKPNTGLSVIPTSCAVLDDIIGVGGFPRGRIIELVGDASAGKSTICLHVIAEAQKMGLNCVIFDTENAMDVEYARNLGVDVDKLIICQVSEAETALEIATKLAESGDIGLIIIDSIAGLVGKEELSGTMENQQMGLIPRILNKYLRKNTEILARNNITLVLTNQLREKIGQSYGEKTQGTGGRGVKHYASVRIKVIRLETEKDKSTGEKTGALTKAIVAKNKVCVPFRECTFSIEFGTGIDNVGSIIDSAVDKKIIEKSGSWYSYNSSRLGQGKANSKDFLKSNPQLLAEITQKLKDQ